jgi:hypothetical protein
MVGALRAKQGLRDVPYLYKGPKRLYQNCFQQTNLTHSFLQLIGGLSYMITCTRGEASHWFSTAILNEMPCYTERESPLCFTHTHMTARVYGVDGLCMLEQLLYTVSDVSLRRPFISRRGVRQSIMLEELLRASCPPLGGEGAKLRRSLQCFVTKTLDERRSISFLAHYRGSGGIRANECRRYILLLIVPHTNLCSNDWGILCTSY